LLRFGETMEYTKISKTEYFLRLLFPPRCICCGAVLPVGILKEVCSDCEKGFKTLDTYEFANMSGSTITRVYSAFDYEGSVRKAIHRLKFGDSPRNAAVLVDLSCQLLKDFLDKPFPGMPGKRYDVIIPAPLHPKRKRQRGYNQSELIAMRLARHMEIPVLKGVLVKKINTPPQSRLKREERLRNVAGVFHVKKPGQVKGRRILLVDDIMTTGSTLEQCARVLTGAGAGLVDAYVVAMRKKV